MENGINECKKQWYNVTKYFLQYDYYDILCIVMF